MATKKKQPAKPVQTTKTGVPLPEANAPVTLLPVQPVKPGYKTTEFWVTLLTLALTQFGPKLHITPGTENSVAQTIVSDAVSAGAVLLYVYSRLKIKKPY